MKVNLENLNEFQLNLEYAIWILANKILDHKPNQFNTYKTWIVHGLVRVRFVPNLQPTWLNWVVDFLNRHRLERQSVRIGRITHWMAVMSVQTGICRVTAKIAWILAKSSLDPTSPHWVCWDLAKFGEISTNSSQDLTKFGDILLDPTEISPDRVDFK